MMNVSYKIFGGFFKGLEFSVLFAVSCEILQQVIRRGIIVNFCIVQRISC